MFSALCRSLSLAPYYRKSFRLGWVQCDKEWNKAEQRKLQGRVQIVNLKNLSSSNKHKFSFQTKVLGVRL